MFSDREKDTELFQPSISKIANYTNLNEVSLNFDRIINEPETSYSKQNDIIKLSEIKEEPKIISEKVITEESKKISELTDKFGKIDVWKNEVDTKIDRISKEEYIKDKSYKKELIELKDDVNKITNILDHLINK